MTRRFYVATAALSEPTVAIEGSLARRIASVLRLRPGEIVTLFDGSGEDATVKLDTVSSKLVAGTVVVRAPSPPEPRTKVHLYQSITKGERFDWLLEKATEIGVARLVPLVTARSVVRTGEGNRLERWQRIAIEAAEQCGRGTVPSIEAPQQFSEAAVSAPGVALVPYEAAGDMALSIQTALNERIDELFASGAVTILIGPEGGYEDGEIEAARAAGVTIVTLGHRVLRAETAGLVATTLVMQACGELG